MKRIIIGDPHGRWDPIKNIYDKEQPDEVIILGDYFDSFDIDAYTQRECYDKIIELRKEHLKLNKGRFIMLIGNHDMHYMDEVFHHPSLCKVDILLLSKSKDSILNNVQILHPYNAYHDFQ